MRARKRTQIKIDRAKKRTQIKIDRAKKHTLSSMRGLENVPERK